MFAAWPADRRRWLRPMHGTSCGRSAEVAETNARHELRPRERESAPAAHRGQCSCTVAPSGTPSGEATKRLARCGPPALAPPMPGPLPSSAQLRSATS
eukprot:362529-Chlamydomonas_euryale.AAC.8